jgi:hypothetical protein
MSSFNGLPNTDLDNDNHFTGIAVLEGGTSAGDLRQCHLWLPQKPWLKENVVCP